MSSICLTLPKSVFQAANGKMRLEHVVLLAKTTARSEVNLLVAPHELIERNRSMYPHGSILPALPGTQHDCRTDAIVAIVPRDTTVENDHNLVMPTKIDRGFPARVDGSIAKPATTERVDLVSKTMLIVHSIVHVEPKPHTIAQTVVLDEV